MALCSKNQEIQEKMMQFTNNVISQKRLMRFSRISKGRLVLIWPNSEARSLRAVLNNLRYRGPIFVAVEITVAKVAKLSAE